MAITNPELIEFDKNHVNSTKPATTLINSGWVFQEIPTSANVNYLFNMVLHHLDFLKKNGGYQFDTGISYPLHAIVIHNGIIYNSLKSSNQGHTPPTAGDANWKLQTAHDTTNFAGLTKAQWDARIKATLVANATHAVTADKMNGHSLSASTSDVSTTTPASVAGVKKAYDKAVATETKLSNANKRMATAWVVYNAKATPVTIRDSFNVKSVVRGGTGYCDITFATQMDNDNYGICAAAKEFNSTVQTSVIAIPDASPFSTAWGVKSCRIMTASPIGRYDVERVAVYFYGGKN